MSHRNSHKIIDVYNENMIEELRKISDLDTEFPGIVYSSPSCNSFFSHSNSHSYVKSNETNSESNYSNIKTNVDNLKIIQLGITLSNSKGHNPLPTSTWQFNFKFDLDKDSFLNESISLLEQAGIDFNRFKHEGIDLDYFSENFIASGIVLNDNIEWVTFHGAYDLAYLLKTLSNQLLPDNESSFLEDLEIYFPNYCDLRYLIRNAVWLKGSLSRIATDLDVERIGMMHQAGSDSLVTSKVFHKLLFNYNDLIDLINDNNILFGLDYKGKSKRNNVNGNFYAYPNIHKTSLYFPVNNFPLVYPPSINGLKLVPSNYNAQTTYDYRYYSGYVPSYGIRK